jgi:hypothetical protein
MGATAEQMMSGAYGSMKIETGAQTVVKPCFGFEAWEDTTFGVFKNDEDVAITTGWEGKLLKADKTAYFGMGVASFTITAGGLGQIYKSK